jgi:hypothetical protein
MTGFIHDLLANIGRGYYHDGWIGHYWERELKILHKEGYLTYKYVGNYGYNFQLTKKGEERVQLELAMDVLAK